MFEFRLVNLDIKCDSTFFFLKEKEIWKEKAYFVQIYVYVYVFKYMKIFFIYIVNNNIKCTSL